MFHAIIALAAVFSADAGQTSSGPPPTPPVPVASAARIDRFAGRPRARIAFSHEVRNFQVKRDGSDDVLYLETRRDRWFRSELSCFGIDDPRDAQGLISLDQMSGFDHFSRIALVSFGHRRTECRLNSLVELTPQEAVEFRLMRPRRAPTSAPAPAPASAPTSAPASAPTL